AGGIRVLDLIELRLRVELAVEERERRPVLQRLDRLLDAASFRRRIRVARAQAEEREVKRLVAGLRLDLHASDDLRGRDRHGLRAAAGESGGGQGDGRGGGQDNE